MNPVRGRKTWALFYKPCILPNFQTLPLHFIPCHPSPTQHLPRYLRVTSFLFVSCRSLTSFPTLQSASSLGALSPRSTNPVTATSRPLFTPRLRPQCHSGHVPRLGPARATWQTPPPAAARLLAHRAPATGPAWTQRIPPGSGAYHLPCGIGHGKGPCSATVDLVSPKVVPVTPPVALIDNRSRRGPQGPA